MDKVINVLTKFDLNDSEAKAYLALHQNGPCTGYEVSKISGVPRSKVYNILENLFNRGFVTTTQDKRSTLYKSEPIDNIANQIKNEVEDNLDLLVKKVGKVSNTENNEHIWNIKGYDNVLNKCLELIERAEKEILIQIWAEELTPRLERSLLNKQKTLGRVLMILYDSKGEYKTEIENVLNHGIEQEKLKDIGSRWITLTIDSREMFHASIRNEYCAEGISTKNTGMVFFAREYVKHDAYCVKIINTFGEEVRSEFGEKHEGIRDIFTIK